MIQKAILYFHGENQETIMSEIVTNLVKTSSNSSGLHVTRKLISLSLKPEYEKYKVEIVQIMAKRAIEMSQNPFANYALQNALDSYPLPLIGGIIEAIKGKIVNLSLIRYSSNVVEHCIEKADEELREELIRELMNSENLAAIMKSRTGNYVVQKALAFAKPTLRTEFKERLQSIIPSSNKKPKVGIQKGVDALG